MSEIRYDAHPSMLRMRPFTTLVVLLILAAGILVAALGKQVLPAALNAQLADLSHAVVQQAGIAVAALAALRLLVWWIATRMDRLVVSDDELIWTHGLLNKQYTEINLSSVRTVRIRQSLSQRTMNAGDVTVFTAGDTPELLVRGLPHPNRVRELVKGHAAPAA